MGVWNYFTSRGTMLLPAMLSMLIAVVVPAAAQVPHRVAAVVNDEVISILDVDARMKLVMVTANLPDTAQTRQRLLPEIIRQLVDDRLKLQEAKRLKIEVTEQEFARQMRRLERQNNIPEGQLRSILEARGVDFRSAEIQIRADIAWLKVINAQMGRLVTIGDQEIDETLNRLEANRGKPRYLVAEILLRVDEPSREQQVASNARDLAEQIRAGASFPALARQFSQSPTSGAGGDLGWVVEGQIEGELMEVLRRMQPGSLSDPIRTSSGYHLLLLRERRLIAQPEAEEVTVNLTQIFMAEGGLAEAEKAKLAERIRTEARDCGSMEKLANELKLPGSGGLGQVRVASLPPAVRDVVVMLPLSTPSERLKVQGGETVLMVCDRSTPSNLPRRQEIAEGLRETRLRLLADRELRNLRRSALVDIRL